MKEKLKRLRNQASIVFKSKFLKTFTPAERYEFLQLCHRRSYKQGEYVFYRNDPGTGMYFIEDGTVELTFTLNEQDESEYDGFILEMQIALVHYQSGTIFEENHQLNVSTILPFSVFLNLISKY